MVDNTTLQISCILVVRPRRSAQLVGVVVDAMVDAEVGAVVDAKVIAIIEETIIGMGIEMIMGMVFKKGEMLGCAIAIVRSVDGIPPIILDFTPLGSVILALLPCLLTMIIGNCQWRLLVFQL